MVFIILLIIIFCIIIFSRKDDLPEYFNPNKAAHTFDLYNKAKPYHVEKWLNNRSLKIEFFYDEIPINHDLTFFGWLEGRTTEYSQIVSILIDHGLNINKTSSTGKNALMGFLDGISPAYLLKAESENLPRVYLKSGFFEDKLIYFKNLGINYSHLDKHECSIYYYAFKNVIGEDISLYPDLLYICELIKKIFNIQPNKNDFLHLLVEEKINLNTAKRILTQFYCKYDIKSLNENFTINEINDFLTKKLGIETYNKLKQMFKEILF